MLCGDFVVYALKPIFLLGFWYYIYTRKIVYEPDRKTICRKYEVCDKCK